MNTFRERAIYLANNCKRVKNNKVYETLAKEFNISKRTAGDRFKSIFKMPVRDYISKNLIPSKEDLLTYIIQSNSFKELYEISGINDVSRLSKLLHKYFGNSNLFKIKLNLVAKIPNKNYKVNREDNESILLSQIYGDGSIERNSCLKIEHGYKQFNYLKFKISLINKAYPTTNGLEGIRKKVSNKNYVSYTYRTKQVLEKQIEKFNKRSLEDNINSMTPLGICLLYLDDGTFHYSKKYNTTCLSIGTVDKKLQKALYNYFLTYGYKFNIRTNGIELNSKIEIIKFIKDFLQPYKEIIPKCMHYKIDYKDIVG